MQWFVFGSAKFRRSMFISPINISIYLFGDHAMKFSISSINEGTAVCTDLYVALIPTDQLLIFKSTLVTDINSISLIELYLLQH